NSGTNLTDNGTVTLGGNQTLASLAGSGTVALGSSTLTLGGTSVFAGAINGTGNVAVLADSSFSGASGYTGSTTVSGAVLSISGSLASLNLNVASAAALNVTNTTA